MEFRYVNYSGIHFYVSKIGTVFVYKPHSCKYELSNPYLNADGYPVVSGCNTITGQYRSVAVHRLVAMAFIPNPECKPEINHKDFNRENFNVDNLEWVTHIENVRYSRKANRYPNYVGENNPNYHNNTLHNKYCKDRELSKLKQSRPKGQNGRAIKCSLYYKDEFIRSFGCQRDAVSYLFDNNKLLKPVTPEYIIGRLKTTQGYKGYKLVI